MNAVQFTQLLEKPSPISDSETTELGHLVERFPYFQSAHLLYLKGLHQNKSIDYLKQLKITAAYANDRKKLYELIMKEDLHEQIRLVEEYSDTERKTVIDVSPLEKQILQEAVSASIKMEVATEPKPEVQEPIEVKEKEEVTVLPARTGVQSGGKEAQVSTDGKRTFNEWLRAAENPSASTVETEDAPADASSDVSTEANAKEEASAKGEEPNLIDKFIEVSPRIGDAKSGESKTGREPFFSPVDTARLSLVDDPSFVTETLANIYEAQGYLKKAKNAYTLLSLKYPQKKATFAARIEALEKALKDQK